MQDFVHVGILKDLLSLEGHGKFLNSSYLETIEKNISKHISKGNQSLNLGFWKNKLIFFRVGNTCMFEIVAEDIE